MTQHTQEAFSCKSPFDLLWKACTLQQYNRNADKALGSDASDMNAKVAKSLGSLHDNVWGLVTTVVSSHDCLCGCARFR